MKLARIAAVALLAVTACQSSSSGAFERGRDAARTGEWDAAAQYYQRALAEEPENVEYRIAFERALLEASRVHLENARAYAAADDPDADIDAAIVGFEIALDYDPTNRYARDELEELLERRDRLAHAQRKPTARSSPFRQGEPILDPSSPERLHVKFPEGSSLRTVLESLAELAGVNILFDESFRDKRVAVDLEGVSYREVLDILMQTNGLFYKPVGSSNVVVVRDH